MLRIVRSPLAYLTLGLVIVATYFSITAERFGTINNFRTILASAAVLGVAAVAVTVALSTGAIDFSIAGHMALSGVLAAWLAERMPWTPAIVLTLAAGLLVGLVNAGIVVGFNVNPFIATLATAGSLRGLAFVFAGSSAGIFMDGGPLTEIGQGRILGLPKNLVVFAVVAIVAGVMMRWSRWGRSLLAVGGNPEAARLAGISVRRATVAGYVVVAAGASLAGLMLAGRTGAGIPQSAAGQELLVFGAVILGGTALWGGRASVPGSVIGILLLATISNGLTLAQTSPHWQTIVQGSALIGAVWAIRRQQEGHDPMSFLTKLLGAPAAAMERSTPESKNTDGPAGAN